MVVEVRRVVIDALRPQPAAPAPALAAFNEEAEGHMLRLPLSDWHPMSRVDGVDVRFPTLFELPLSRLAEHSARAAGGWELVFRSPLPRRRESASLL